MFIVFLIILQSQLTWFLSFIEISCLLPQFVHFQPFISPFSQFSSHTFLAISHFSITYILFLPFMPPSLGFFAMTLDIYLLFRIKTSLVKIFYFYTRYSIILQHLFRCSIFISELLISWKLIVIDCSPCLNCLRECFSIQ